MRKRTMQVINIKSLLAVSALAFLSVPAMAQVVKVDGSSTVYPITEGVAEEFQKANKGLKVTVGVSGTGGGFKKFCRGETDIADASRPISGKKWKPAGPPASNTTNCLWHLTR